MRRRAVATVAVAVSIALIVLAGCAGSDPEATTPSVPPTMPPPPLGFSDADDGRTVTAAVGQRVRVILHSSEFVFSEPSDTAVLRPEGPPSVTASPPACVEVPGSGCGTVVASFVGVAPGEAALDAQRPDCAEPECGPADARWRLVVRVVSPSAVTAAPQAEVTGTVLFSPVCPVESDPPDPACAPRPGPATVELARADGIVVALDRAGDDGAFAIPVAPGDYQIFAFPADASIGGGCRADPASVRVTEGTSTLVAVTCDTGIR